MKILTKDEVEVNKQVILEVAKNGAVFIHPTDTIYGLGCNALREDCVEEVRRIKERPDTPFSVIAPSKQWIKENCVVSHEAEKWIKKLPGPYTLILKSKNTVAKNIAPGLDSLGVRIPEHWFSKVVEELGFPVVTTSANKSGGDFMTSLDNLDDGIKPKVEFVIYEGEKHGRPSNIIDLTGQEVKVKER
ncbi:MAG: threonylcarbamoyl-AMP synthase [Nanoarchaeota archaeon]|nr:threonylcarbamoyl-AMP synthase [Nanoarchaeota archaeon]MBU1005248.1 threonylcarbamoyl-AMP synthase [Nanoarchaeota archaeon]MBU1945785.1 threonylcarbamoyl-AMP synthase [Nanoarchaeota archaeon]